mmetsp:Transcript_9113/g.28919  ORF Transcript_9113/g.28919 Transcript_9113/m.28919 type:complete len:605 (-) Transcript_9113:1063-2877(-)
MREDEDVAKQMDAEVVKLPRRAVSEQAFPSAARGAERRVEVEPVRHWFEKAVIVVFRGLGHVKEPLGRIARRGRGGIVDGSHGGGGFVRSPAERRPPVANDQDLGEEAEDLLARLVDRAEEGRALPGEAEHSSDEVEAHLGVESARGFIEEHDGGEMDHLDSGGAETTLAGGEAADERRGARVDAEQVEDDGGALGHVFARGILEAEHAGDADGLGDSQVRNEDVVLHHVALLLVALALGRRLAVVLDRAPAEAGRLAAADDVQEGRFARAARPHDREEVARGGGGGDAAQQRLDFDVARAGVDDAHRVPERVDVDADSFKSVEALALFAVCRDRHGDGVLFRVGVGRLDGDDELAAFLAERRVGDKADEEHEDDERREQEPERGRRVAELFQDILSRERAPARVEEADDDGLVGPSRERDEHEPVGGIAAGDVGQLDRIARGLRPDVDPRLPDGHGDLGRRRPGGEHLGPGEADEVGELRDEKIPGPDPGGAGDLGAADREEDESREEDVDEDEPRDLGKARDEPIDRGRVGAVGALVFVERALVEERDDAAKVAENAEHESKVKARLEIRGALGVEGLVAKGSRVEKADPGHLEYRRLPNGP